MRAESGYLLGALAEWLEAFEALAAHQETCEICTAKRRCKEGKSLRREEADIAYRFLETIKDNRAFLRHKLSDEPVQLAYITPAPARKQALVGLCLALDDSRVSACGYLRQHSGRHEWESAL